MVIKNSSSKKSWLTVGLVAAALTLGACGKKDEAPMETDSSVDAQTTIEDEATGVATSSDDVAVASANETSTDDVAVASANDEVTVGADDKEMLDGTEDSEHVSTY